MLQSKIFLVRMSLLRTVAAVVVTLLLAALAPARAADPVSADDSARFLAGLPPSAQSPLAALTKEASWQRHARFLDTAFGQLEQRQLSKIRAWSASNLAAPRPTMFYMFSGPDFLYADAFYSSATTYVLSALEPVGSVPDLTRSPYLGATLYDIEHSMSSILSFSFFITKHMKTDLRAGEASGTLPILYVFLARSGKTIREVSLITLDETGAVHSAGERASKNPTRGVRIKFAGTDGVEKTLYFFSTDLSNGGVRASGFLKFCATLAPGDSLLKSASYLLHAGNFSVVRNFLLNNSASIIQDDSGIPLGDYDARKWKFLPFGRYAGPISKFPGRYQPKYAELFQRSQPMDFGIGYRWRSHESNLLLSVRLASDGPGAVETTSSTPVEPVRPRPPRPKRPLPEPPVEQPRGLFFFFR
jgi:hypothetical protein